MSKGLAAAAGVANPGISAKEKEAAAEAINDVNRDVFEICEEFPDRESINRLRILRLFSDAARTLPVYALTPSAEVVQHQLSQVQQGLVPQPIVPNGHGFQQSPDAGQLAAGPAPQQGTPQPQPAPASSEEQAKAAAYDKLAEKVQEFLQKSLPDGYTMPMDGTLLEAFNAFTRQFKANSVAKDSNAAHAKELKDLREKVQNQAQKAATAHNSLGTVDALLDKYHVFEGRFGNKFGDRLPEDARKERVLTGDHAKNLRDAIIALQELGKPKQ